MKSIAKDILKVSLIGIVVWLAINVDKPKAAVIPAVTTDMKVFTFKGLGTRNIQVNTWTDDGIKCTTASSIGYGGTENPTVAISCVKL